MCVLDCFHWIILPFQIFPGPEFDNFQLNSSNLYLDYISLSAHRLTWLSTLESPGKVSVCDPSRFDLSGDFLSFVKLYGNKMCCLEFHFWEDWSPEAVYKYNSELYLPVTRRGSLCGAATVLSDWFMLGEYSHLYPLWIWVSSTLDSVDSNLKKR